MGDLIPFNAESWLNMRYIQDNIRDMKSRNGKDDLDFDIALRKQGQMYKEFISEYRQTVH